MTCDACYRPINPTVMVRRDLIHTPLIARGIYHASLCYECLTLFHNNGRIRKEPNQRIHSHGRR